MIYYLNPGAPDTMSGGTRKLIDHVAILHAHGFDVRTVWGGEIGTIEWDPARDIVVVPEVFGDFLDVGIPHPVRRISFVQNSYLVARWGCHDPVNAHPFITTADLAAIFTESQHTEDRLREMFPDLAVPLIRTHSSGNGRAGQPAGFSFGDWPREKWVLHFDYKYIETHSQVFSGLPLPDGWEIRCMAGMTDQEIAATMRRGSIFAAANREEGMCAPTSEAMIAGCAIVCWPGGPSGQTTEGGPMEYLAGRAVIAVQDDIADLRNKTIATAESIDFDPWKWAARARRASDWFQSVYSREREIDEIVGIFEELHPRGDSGWQPVALDNGWASA